jgi:four helix bundle protein
VTAGDSGVNIQYSNIQYSIMEAKKPFYNLEQRTEEFGRSTISFCRKFRRDPVSSPLITQIVRSSTSVGANYMEANGGNSRKEFSHKINICKKEANETKYWFKMLLPFCNPEQESENMALTQEAHELVCIFQKIGASMKLSG